MYNAIDVYSAWKCKQLPMPWQNKNCYIWTITTVCWIPTIFSNSSRTPHWHVREHEIFIQPSDYITRLVPKASKTLASLSRWWWIEPSVKPYRFFSINFSASFSIWVHCARRTITHLDIAGLALAFDIPRAYRYRLLFPFTPFPPSSLFLYPVLALCKSLTFSVPLSPSAFSTNKVHARLWFYEARRNFVH